MKKQLFKNMFLVYVLFWGLWLLHFILGKTIFFLYNYQNDFQYTIGDFSQTIFHGLKLDFSTIGYVMIIPTIICWVHSRLDKKILINILKYFMYTTLSISTFLIYVDMHLFKYWGQKLDTFALSFLKQPSAVIASFDWDIFFPVLLLSMHLTIIIFIFKQVFQNINNYQEGTKRWSQFFLFFFVAATIFLPIRGGLDLYPKIQLGIPINIGDVYFSSEDYLNQTAVNVPWYLGFSFDKQETEKYSLMNETEAQQITKELFKKTDTSSDTYLKQLDPNVVLIVLESFTGNAIGCLGGEQGLTPKFDELSKEGILFSNFYANATRSDKGNTALITGHPSFPKNTVLNFPQKMNKLAYLPRVLAQKGYVSSYLYGGDMNFFNFNMLMKKAGFDKIISKSNFTNDQLISKWGVPDEITFDSLFTELNQPRKQPIFQMYFSLSNHPPFDIPAPKKFKGNDLDDNFRSTVFYTDSCLGRFIDKAKMTTWWDNTLFIVVADHGANRLLSESVRSPKKYKIPMLWLGGVLKTKEINEHLGTQIDLASTLINQLHIDNSNFPYSKDLLNSNSTHFAYYSSSNGVGFINKQDTSFYHLSGLHERYVKGKFIKDEKLKCTQQKAILQKISYDFFD